MSDSRVEALLRALTQQDWCDLLCAMPDGALHGDGVPCADEDCELEHHVFEAPIRRDYSKAADVLRRALEHASPLPEPASDIAKLRKALRELLNYFDVDNLTTQTVYRAAERVLDDTAGSLSQGAPELDGVRAIDGRPEGPWQVVLGPTGDFQVIGNAGTYLRQPTRTEAEAIAVRDALNRVAASPAENSLTRLDP